MKHLRHIVGKTVARIEVERFKPRESEGDHSISSCLNRIHFTDGSWIYFLAHESEDAPYVQAVYNPATDTNKK